MSEDNGYTFRNWREVFDDYMHCSTLSDYVSDDIIENEKIEFREEYWQYLEENEFWD